jgi:hypothetical protein
MQSAEFEIIFWYAPKIEKFFCWLSRISIFLSWVSIQCKTINTWKTAINLNCVLNFHHAENTLLSHYKNQLGWGAQVFRKSSSHLKTQSARGVVRKR